MLHINGVHILHKLHIMPGPRVEKVSVFHLADAHDVYHLEPHRPLRFLDFARNDTPVISTKGATVISTKRSARRNLRPSQNHCLMDTVRCQKVPCPVGRGGFQAKVIGKGNYASASVAAHHSAGAVGVVELHPEVLARGLSEDHQAVRAVFLAKSLDALRLAILIHTAFTAVKDHEVVTCSGEYVGRFCHLADY